MSTFDQDTGHTFHYGTHVVSRHVHIAHIAYDVTSYEIFSISALVLTLTQRFGQVFKQCLNTSLSQVFIQVYFQSV